MTATRRFPRPLPARGATVVPALVACGLFAVMAGGSAHAQFGGGGLGGGGLGGGGFNGFNNVGGISIDTDGIVRNLDARTLETLAQDRRQALATVAPMKAGGLRKVSLAGIVAAVNDGAAKAKPLAPEVLLLGGLERITHVFVDPDGHDIILAGPADTAAVDAAGNVVAAGSGRPLLQLEDLIVALRAIDQARAGGIQCSIDPTPDGLAALKQFMAAQKTIGPDPQAVLNGMEKALGPQTVRVGGVPSNSRFARVLVAADYRMKRIGMGLESSGLAELPSYLSMAPAGRAIALPRFWLEADYDPIARDADELAWRIGGRRMKCCTESDLAAKDGVRRGAAPADAVAERWCESMTAQYDKLAAKQPIFAELVNCVDLAVVAALIKGRQLDQRAGLDLAPLLDEAKVPLPRYEVAATVPTVASGIKKGTTWVLSASGGVQFQPWAFAANANAVADVGDARTAAMTARPAAKTSWWWD